MADLKRATSSPSLLPSWHLECLDDTIRCVGGPDELHVLSDLSADSFAALKKWIDGDEILFTTTELIDVREFLTTIGALDAPIPAATPLAWRHVGSVAVAEQVADTLTGLAVPATDDLTVVVRTAGSLSQLVEYAAGLDGPHLLLDMTGHHTLSLGPFVSPGLTSCIGCYGTRLQNRWGDDPGPDEPATNRWVNLAAELLAIQIERIASRTSPLVNATINWDLQAGATTRDHLLRAPDCPVCTRSTSGALSAPLDTPYEQVGA